MSERCSLLAQWLGERLNAPGIAMTLVSGDASFRRYWRIHHQGRSLIAMDAPPDQEDSGRFVRIAGALRAVGLNVPEILIADLERGFLLIGDLGTRSYLDVLDETNADRLYGEALEALALIQARVPTAGLPPYDEGLLRRELAIFTEWLLTGLLRLPLTAGETQALAAAWDLLVANALEQPRVCVHRDFHSRNLMVSSPQPGILDFQDAVAGPMTYDVVCLLRDCYIAWPADRVRGWALGYFDLAVRSGLLGAGQEETCLRWMDLMGIQRHLKAAGIFARLKLRDGKPNYLKDIPRTLGYVLAVAPAYPALRPLADLIGERVLPLCLDQVRDSTTAN